MLSQKKNTTIQYIFKLSTKNKMQIPANGARRIQLPKEPKLKDRNNRLKFQKCSIFLIHRNKDYSEQKNLPCQ
jgi:hypothetical protein